MNNPRKVYELWVSGESMMAATDSELCQAVAFFEKLTRDLYSLGPQWRLAGQEANRAYMALDGFLRARNPLVPPYLEAADWEFMRADMPRDASRWESYFKDKGVEVKAVFFDKDAPQEVKERFAKTGRLAGWCPTCPQGYDSEPYVMYASLYGPCVLFARKKKT